MARQGKILAVMRQNSMPFLDMRDCMGGQDVVNRNGGANENGAIHETGDVLQPPSPMLQASSPIMLQVPRQRSQDLRGSGEFRRAPSACSGFGRLCMYMCIFGCACICTYYIYTYVCIYICVCNVRV